MTVWIFEENLMWSERLKRSLAALGHEPVVLAAIPAEGSADAALVNLSSRRPEPSALVAALRARGIVTIGFAGHKEGAALELGKVIGCDVLATNSEMTFRPARVLERAFLPDATKTRTLPPNLEDNEMLQNI